MQAQFKTLAETKAAAELVKQVYQQATGKPLIYQRLYSNKVKHGYNLKFHCVISVKWGVFAQALRKHGLAVSKTNSFGKIGFQVVKHA